MRFEQYHPSIHLIWFAAAFGCVIAFDHPTAVLIAYAATFACMIRCRGRRALRYGASLLVLIALWTLWYASFHHFGVTVLGTNAIGNSITKESIVYGLVSGIRLAAIIQLAVVFFTVFSTDEVTYLTGRISPRLSLYLAIALRWLPETARSARRIKEARRGVHLYTRVRGGLQVLSATGSLMLERFAVLSSSMKSRGYGLKGRTSYSVYRFESRDRLLVILICALTAVMVTAAAFGVMSVLYDPSIIVAPISPVSCLVFVVYALFLSLPLVSGRA